MPGFHEAIFLVIRTLGNFLLLFLPAVAASVVMVKRGCRNIVIVSLVALVVIGACGYFDFWFSFLWLRLGRFLALAIPIIRLSAL
jgi:hypothetical protein